jgi:hypothetical protein
MLEKLSLRGDLLDDKGIIVIGETLIENKVLNILDLSCNRQITSSGWRGFSICLKSPTCALKELDFSECGEVNGIASTLAINTSVEKLDIAHSRVTDTGVIDIADALVVNSSLRELRMNFNSTVTSAGWVVFFKRLSNSTCSLEKLDLDYNVIENEGAAALVDLLAGMINLKCLKLCFCNSITNNGWRVISRIPQTGSNVISLDLGGEHVNDDTVISFATALATNNCLRGFYLAGREITDRIWDAITDILCDYSSILSTYHSNHTLQTSRIYSYRSHRFIQAPFNIARVLALNATHEDKVVLARHKIIANHFSDSKINTHAFALMTVPVLPQALEWIGRDSLGFSLMYQVLQGTKLSELVVGINRALNGRKRKSHLN